MNWIRIAVGIGDDPRVHATADTLGVRIPEAVGMLVMLLTRFPEHAPDGSLASVPDASIERWGGWTGERGAFAASVRGTFLDEAGVWLAWEKYNGSALREAAAARKRARDNRKPKGPNGSPDGSPKRSPNGEANGTENGGENGSPLRNGRDVTDGTTTLAAAARARGEVARRLTAAVNAEMDERFGLDRPPVPASSAMPLVLAMEEQGIGADFALMVAVEVASKKAEPVGSMAYFVKPVQERWAQHMAREDAAKVDRRSPVIAGYIGSEKRDRRAATDAAIAEGVRRLQEARAVAAGGSRGE